MKRYLTAFAMVVIFLAPATAFAQGGILGCGAAVGGGSLFQAAAHTAVTGAASGLPVSDLGTHVNTSIANIHANIITQKECVLDGLGIALAKGMISALTQSIVDWINNGFEGSPAFVTDLRGFLGDVADHTSLDFIEGTELGVLCSPFELEVRLALTVQRQPFQERIRCSLGDAIDNAEDFFRGDFSQGGWPAWFSVHTQLRNSPYGAYLLASAELNARIASRRGEEVQLLNLNDGWFSKGKCSLPGAGSLHTLPATVSPGSSSSGLPQHTGAVNATPNTNTKNGCLSAGGHWEIVTPGKQIENRLEDVLGSGIRQLELADEFDEIISALIAQLAQQTLTSIDGLRGLSSRTSSSAQTITDGGASRTGSYLEALAAENEAGSISTAREALLDDIEAAIDLEETAQELYEGLIANLERAEREYGELYECYIDLTLHPEKVTGISGSNALKAAENASSTSAAIITPQIDRYEGALASSITTVQALVSIRAAARGAETAEELNAAAEEYDSLLSSGIVHANADVLFLANDFEAQRAAIAALNQQANIDIGQCRKF